MLANRVFAFAWVVLGNIALVLADGRAAPYEVLFFYYSYTAEYNFNGGDLSKMTIGWKCVPASPGPGQPTPKRACTFHEFLKSTYKFTGDYALHDPFDLDAFMAKNPTATVDQIAKELVDNHGFGTGTWKWNTPDLLKTADKSWGIDMVFSKFSSIFSDIQDSSSITGLSNINDALTGARKERAASNTTKNYLALADYMKGKSVVLQPKTTTTAIGSNIMEVDKKASFQGLNIKKATTADKDMTKKLTQLEQKGDGKKHQAILNTLDEVSDRLAQWGAYPDRLSAAGIGKVADLCLMQALARIVTLVQT
ncbi:hypothetical protein GQ53DRAFT_850447 [Thozetella sp. PMI_491]|nr:hypothetical protein GQ53DRAFT_850447 [Thozetella sp. PMI_491]